MQYLKQGGWQRNYIFLLLFPILFVSCSFTKAAQQQKQQQTLPNITQPEENKCSEKLNKAIARTSKKLKKVFNQQKKEFIKKVEICQNELDRLKNIPCKPEKVVEVQREKVYITRTINFAKYKKLLEKRISAVKSLRKRKEIAEKLFFIFLAEKNWTKAYDIYKLYLEKNKMVFSDVLLAYIYLNNAETEEAKKIFNNYNKEEFKPLKIKVAKFCRKILSYGIFEPKPNHLKKGSSAILYVLLENVKLMKVNDGYKANLSIKISLGRKNEKYVLLDEDNINTIYRHLVLEVLLPIRIQIPLNLSYNYYYMNLNIIDLNSNQSVNKVMKVKIIE